MHRLIATDLDGTLLDDTYPLADAAAAVVQLQSEYPNTEVTLASSKTLAELRDFAGYFPTPPPLIFENGGGYARADAAGDYTPHSVSADRSTVLTALNHARDRGARFRGFADMNAAEVSERTGLSLDGARLALDRHCTEPLVWEGSPEALTAFYDDLAAAGLEVVRGGRFLHVHAGVCKWRAFDALIRSLPTPAATVTFGCGDAANDAELLDRCDFGIAFPDRLGGYIRQANERILHASTAGPAGWLAALRRALARAPEQPENSE